VIIITLTSIWQAIFLLKDKHKENRKLFILYNVLSNNHKVFSLTSLVYTGTKALILLNMGILSYYISLFLVIFIYSLITSIKRKVNAVC
jgi:hypothetical protein